MRKYIILSILALTMVVLATTAHSKLVTRAVPYQHNGVKLEGYMAYMDPLKYSPSADERSWSHMKVFFQEIFGTN